MFQHVVLFGFPEPLGEADDAELRSLLRSLATEAECIQAMRFGRSVTDWTGGFDYLLYVELTEEAALPAYLSHPRHVAVGQWIQARECTSVVFDYAVDEATVIGA